MLALCVLFWSGNFIIGRGVSEAFDAIELAFFRWGGVFVVLLPFLIYRRKKILQGFLEDPLLIATLGLLGIAGFNTILYIGLHDTTAINALLINSIIPILILFLSALILKAPISALQFVGIVISTIGVVFLIIKADFANLSSLKFNAGDIWIIISSITWALYSVLVKKRARTLGDFDYFVLIVFIGFCILLPIYLWQGYPMQRTVGLMTHFYPQILYVVFFPSIASYYLWHRGIEEIGSSKTGQFTHLMPIFGASLAFVFLGEQFLLYHFIGMGMIFLGIYFSLFAKK
jgi:drug/metabolite transporter (DMT)-like permease